MVIDGINTKCTEADKRGFYFEELNDKEKTEEKKRQKVVFILRLFGCGFGIICMIVLIIAIATGAIACDPPKLKHLAIGMFSVFGILFVFLWAVNIGKYVKRWKDLKNNEVKCIHIEILQKLPKEYKLSASDYEDYFYPVMGKDLKTGYESVCYIGEEEYTEGKEHDTVLIKIVKQMKS